MQARPGSSTWRGAIDATSRLGRRWRASVLRSVDLEGGFSVLGAPGLAFVREVWRLRRVMRELQAMTGALPPGWSSIILGRALTKAAFVNVSVHPAIVSQLVTRGNLCKPLGSLSIAYRHSFGNAIVWPATAAFAYHD
jgi:hypothetical protein